MLQSNKATTIRISLPNYLINTADTADIADNAEFTFISHNKCIKQSVFSIKIKTSKYNTSS